MIAVDTNILVRLITKDDTAQYRKVRRLFETEIIFVTDTVFLETAWVLSYTYKFDPKQITSALRKLLGLPNIQVADSDVLNNAMVWVDNGLDFADALHLAKSQSVNTLYTFDKQFAKRSHGMGDCSVTIL